MPFSFDFGLGDFAKNPIVLWLVIVILILWIVRDFVKTLPAFLKIKALIYIPLANWFQFKFLQKEAIKSDIQGTINYAVNPIIKELPEGSIKPLQIEYINRVEP